jgi:hypothetical protein
MFYALLLICLGSDPACSVENAIYAEQSPPMFASETACHHGALAHLREISPPQLKENTEYQIEIACERADDPA